MTGSRSRVRVGLMRRDELPLLRALWASAEVMRYADELPVLRGCTRRPASCSSSRWRARVVIA